MKKLTKFMAGMWLICLCLYSSMLIGSLAHELMHKKYSLETSAIHVDYSGEGYAKGVFSRHSHDWVYLNGDIVMVFLMVISMFSIFILMQ